MKKEKGTQEIYKNRKCKLVKGQRKLETNLGKSKYQ